MVAGRRTMDALRRIWVPHPCGFSRVRVLTFLFSRISVLYQPGSAPLIDAGEMNHLAAFAANAGFQ
jgi:hypothetical protein